ncbi:uncharacterized protein FTOL_12346 [Fusarium torulosum]|uniref:Heterokaryon incompatibility domain-containing protein n=1 Tax=Fusarium torulosum TaxID=33205 RepID=A0AAE8SNS9_9HYPO|nr:uncharacterized protein FTOL_12346 [Fusarium torulosum]
MVMHEIYSQAQEVLIYLGKSDSTVQGAIEAMCWLDWKFMCLYARQFLSGPNIGMASFWIDSWTKMKPITREDFSWDPIINLLRRSWFQRTWVIQEAKWHRSNATNKCVLGLPELLDRHTGENIAEQILDIVREFKIGDKLGYFTLDNTSNNKTIIEELGRELVFD